MIQIKFNQKYKEQIQNNEKTSTIRISDKKLETGTEFLAVFLNEEDEITSEQLLLCTGVTIKKFKELNLKDANRDGYNTKTSLKQDLNKYYPNITEDTQVYIYTFKTIPSSKDLQELTNIELAYDTLCTATNKKKIIQIVNLLAEPIEKNDWEECIDITFQLLNLFINNNSIKVLKDAETEGLFDNTKKKIETLRNLKK